MKLCPQCDFIYEDDQSVCDMDGNELVFEPTLTALPGTSPFVPTVLPARVQSRRFQSVAVTAMAAILLAVTVFLFYYVFAQRVSSARPAASPASTTNPTLPVPKESTSPSALATPVATRPNELEGTEAGSEDLQTAKLGSTSDDQRQTNQASTGNPVAGAKPSLSVFSLPRVKALPQLKPLPKLEERNATKQPTKATVRQVAGNAREKKDSRVGSFLKKTARMITKPFKR
jgi:hypothetical protein